MASIPMENNVHHERSPFDSYGPVPPLGSTLTGSISNYTITRHLRGAVIAVTPRNVDVVIYDPAGKLWTTKVPPR